MISTTGLVIMFLVGILAGVAIIVFTLGIWLAIQENKQIKLLKQSTVIDWSGVRHKYKAKRARKLREKRLKKYRKISLKQQKKNKIK